MYNVLNPKTILIALVKVIDIDSLQFFTIIQNITFFTSLPSFEDTFVYFRTIVALGHLVLSCNQVLYIKLIDYLVNDLSTQQPAARSKTSIQCIAAIW